MTNRTPLTLSDTGLYLTRSGALTAFPEEADTFAPSNPDAPTWRPPGGVETFAALPALPAPPSLPRGAGAYSLVDRDVDVEALVRRLAARLRMTPTQRALLLTAVAAILDA